MLKKWAEWINAFDATQMDDNAFQRELDRHQLLANACRGLPTDDNRRWLKAIFQTAQLPHQIGGVVGPAMATSMWGEVKDVDSMNWLTAGFIGAELASRVGLCLWFCDPLERQALMSAIATVACKGKLQGLTPKQLNTSLSLAFSFAPRLSLAIRRGGFDSFWSVVQDVANNAISQALSDRSRTQIDKPERLNSKGAVYGAWMSDFNHRFSAQLLLSTAPGSLENQVAFQAVNEILNRHLKAADKRLRVDQVQSISIEGPLRAPWDIGLSCPLTQGGAQTALEWALGILVKHHTWRSEDLLPDALEKDLDSIYDVACNIVYEPNYQSTLAGCEILLNTHAPIFFQQNASELTNCFLKWHPTTGRLNRMRLKRMLKHAVSNDSAFRLEEYSFVAPVKAALATTRGGLWPERRQNPFGGPNSDPDQRSEQLKSIRTVSAPKSASDLLDRIFE